MLVETIRPLLAVGSPVNNLIVPFNFRNGRPTVHRTCECRRRDRTSRSSRPASYTAI